MSNPPANGWPQPPGSWGEKILDIDEDYRAELALRQRILTEDPSRCTVLPHMRAACWDTMLTLMRELARTHPQTMSLHRTPDNGWLWTNSLLGIEQAFRAGDESSLPTDPLRYIGAQVQDDLVLLDQREGDLFADAGLVTFAADWSLAFDIGMSFLEVHGPVPRVHENSVINRAHQFLMRLQPGDAYRRTNWTMTVDHKLDTSTETYPEWGRDRRLVLADGEAELARRLHLRVEVQHLIRLAESGAVLFLIRSYLLPCPNSPGYPPGGPGSPQSWLNYPRTWPTTRASADTARRQPPGSPSSPKTGTQRAGCCRPVSARGASRWAGRLHAPGTCGDGTGSPGTSGGLFRPGRATR